MAKEKIIRHFSIDYGKPLTLQQRVSTLIDVAGGASEVGRILNVHRETVSNWASGKTRAPLKEISELSEHVGASMDWIAGAWERLERTQQTVAESSEFVMIKKLDVRASAGFGALNDENQTGLVSFRRDWLRERGINPNAATVIAAWGDSMEPTIRSGDTLLVDNSIDRIKDEGIYVLVVNGLTIVKRLMMKANGDLKLSSDNPQFESEIVKKKDLESLRVAGRVMWFGRTI